MGLKKLEIANPNSCLNKAEENEPIFVLRAQDKLSPILIEAWASFAELVNCDPSKVFKARECAKDMREWGINNSSKFPD